MTDSAVFTNLLTEIAEQLGVKIAVNDGEELTVNFDDGLTGVISHLTDRRQIFLKVGVLRPDGLSEVQAASLSSLLLRMNEVLMPERSMSIAVGADRIIQVMTVASQDTVNAIQVADAFEAMVKQGRLTRAFLEKFIAGDSTAPEYHIPKNPPESIAIKV